MSRMDAALGDAIVDRDELLKLRVGIARVAMRLGMPGEIPGNNHGLRNDELPFEVLRRFAEQQERGWNALLARIMDALPETIPQGAHVLRWWDCPASRPRGPDDAPGSHLCAGNRGDW